MLEAAGEGIVGLDELYVLRLQTLNQGSYSACTPITWLVALSKDFQMIQY
jgi:hypothetical protein